MAGLESLVCTVLLIVLVSSHVQALHGWIEERGKRPEMRLDPIKISDRT